MQPDKWVVNAIVLGDAELLDGGWWQRCRDTLRRGVELALVLPDLGLHVADGGGEATLLCSDQCKFLLERGSHLGDHLDRMERSVVNKPCFLSTS